MKKIMIFGLPGSGKSTFASELKKHLHLPVYHLDRHFYTKNWKERDYSEFLKIQKSFIERDGWIIEGNSMKSLEMRFKEADTAIYFEFPRSTCLWRIFKRRFQKKRAIEDRAEDCSEALHPHLFKYLWNYEKRYAPEIHSLKVKYPNVIFHTFSNAQDIQKFLKSIQNS